MQKIKIFILLISIISFVSCKKKQEKISNFNGQDTQIDLYLKECESNGFNGSLLIVKNDSIILNKGYGFANKKNSIPNTPETVFDICSVTKQFTGAAIVKLVEEGQLKVTDSLSQYFKDIPLDKREITIHQLLTHSAGFGHGIGNGDFDHIPQDIYFKKLFSSQLRFKPGINYSYSNSGYSVLGRIIELVSGKSYEDYLKEKLFEPSGMYHTGYLLPNWDNNSNANEYLYNVINKGNHVSWYKQDGKIAWTLKANGGINSTQNDMYKWYLALKNNKVLNKSSIEKLTAPYVAENEDESSHYAYGWAIFESNRNSKVISHNGFNGVSYYEFSWFPEEDALILFATNTSTREASRIPYELEKMLFDSSYIAQPMPKSEFVQLLMFTENYSGDIKNLGKALKSNFEELLKTPVSLNRLSGVYMREKRLNKAIYTAKLNTELFPDDGKIWDTMGDIYFNAKQNDKAIESYQRALELRPDEGDCFWCENSQGKLKILR